MSNVETRPPRHVYNLYSLNEVKLDEPTEKPRKKVKKDEKK